MLGKFINKLHILQNIYLKNKYLSKKKSYAMDGEDLAIDQYVNKIEKGFYVDIGAHHPIQRNNTNLLFKKGWEGINIDINEFSIDLFNFLRPDDLNLLTAISDKEGEISFYYQKKFSQLNTTDKKIANEHFQGKFKERTVKCRTIQNILDQSRYKNRKIDFLNIDVEGHELSILSSIDYNRFNIKFISVEMINHNEESKVVSQKLKDLLNKNNYLLEKVIGCNYIFKKK